MSSSASIRHLRNRFPRVRAALQPALRDYLERMKRRQPQPMSAAAAKALDEQNRGGR